MPLVQRCHTCAAEWDLPIGAPAASRFAVVTAFAESYEPGYARIRRHTPSILFTRAQQLGCNLRHVVGYRGDMVAIVHGLRHSSTSSNSSTHDQLAASGWIVYNVTESLHGRYANLPGRNTSLTLPTPASKLYARFDGWATLYKFYAWTLLQYEQILFMDSDVVFHENPEPALLDAATKRILFQSPAERAKRGYNGLNVHIFYLRPSMAIFSLLLGNAVQGHTMPYIHTEQDVLETVFPPVLHSDWNASTPAIFPQVKHYGGFRTKMPTMPGCERSN